MKFLVLSVLTFAFSTANLFGMSEIRCDNGTMILKKKLPRWVLTITHDEALQSMSEAFEPVLDSNESEEVYYYSKRKGVIGINYSNATFTRSRGTFTASGELANYKGIFAEEKFSISITPKSELEPVEWTFEACDYYY